MLFSKLLLALALQIGSAAGIHQIELDWTPPDGINVAYYNVYRGDLPGGPYTLIGKTSGVSYVDSAMPLMKNCGYYYVVTTVDQTNAESGYSNEVRADLP
jgi:fibronectin type 3 domain-containing protein